MKISEPMTMITDYLLTIFMLIWSYLIIKNSNNLGSTLWAIAFIFSGVGAFFGGTSHGFKEEISEKTNTILWKLTTFSIGLTSYFMLTGSIVTSTSNEFIIWFGVIIGSLGLIIYLYWMINHDEFIYVIINYGSTMLVLIILKLFSYYQFHDPSSFWIISGILVAFLGSYIQASGKGLHKHFNHNDLFHIIQLFSAYLLYKGILVSVVI